jgi:hypothetical protein
VATLGGQSELPVGNYCVIGFLRGLLINHGTPPSSLVTQSNPIAPKHGQDTQPVASNEAKKFPGRKVSGKDCESCATAAATM